MPTILLSTKTPTKGADGGSVCHQIHRCLLFLDRLSPSLYPRLQRFLWLSLLGFWLVVAPACQRLPSVPRPEWLPALWGEPLTPTPPQITAELHLATWSASEAVNEYFNRRLTAYQQLQPDTYVELHLLPNYPTRLRTLLESDEPSDVIRINTFMLPDLVARGLLVPLPAAVAALADLSPLLRSMGEVDGKLYCMPHEVNTLALLYNRTLFDAAQLAYPTTDWQWETLRTTAEQLTDATTGHYGLVLPADFSRWLPFLYQVGGSVTDSGSMIMTINRPEAATALQFYTDLVLDGMAAAPTTVGSSWAGEAFAQGHAAMVIEGNWMISYLAEQSPALTYGVAPLPVGPAGKATVAFVSCYAISHETTNLAAASKLIEFLTGIESQQAWIPLTAALPTHPTTQAEWAATYPDQLAFLDALADAYPWRFAPGFQPVVDQMNSGIGRIFGGFILVDGALAEAETVGNDRLQP